ncbi:phosphocholine-specific phospholipase C [Arenibacter certesii]|uniref:phospholipase C n=1 Tax=Arenibacter certesii TaxID=228955 RepID=A0A918IWV9_9FLAO|nr:phospholipase C, phosphocholine-specific [Arenibacter certesii]GGW36091.1 non-hemolytic phospholipase C [Arenibacter certesii]
MELNRRKFIKLSAGAGLAATVWPPLVQKALAVVAHNATQSIHDVEHIVILMQENRSFDHYFGTLKGVRGFGDRFPIPLESGQRAFYQSDGQKIVPPYRADRKSSNAALIKGTPHDIADMQAAWNQGKYGLWPLFKTPFSMAYYTREEIPFQYALAEAFTISDAHHCSIATGTDPNRIMFWSGSNFDPELRAAGINCTDKDSEPVNLRCWIKGTMPDPGYTYQGDSFKWATIPDVLEKEGVSWRIYQDPNNNWTGAMHGGLAFESFRTAKPGTSIYENGMRHWSMQDLKDDVKNNTLPQVTWILPSKDDSEHPGAPSSPYRGADFTQKVLDALTSNPEVWSKTVFFLTFDENDGLFDHVPAPAVPSYNLDNTLAGKSTLDLAGMYFHNDKDPFDFSSESQKGFKNKIKYHDPRDTISGNIRPWGLGPRVPLYIISPWTRGGWVDSQVADHTSVGQFLEKRFGIEIPAISPWHRSICSDLVSAFDFVKPNDPVFPALPETANFATLDAASKKLPIAAPPPVPSPLYQERGTRYSRALPYRLNVRLNKLLKSQEIKLVFENEGDAGVVYHVYDLKHLDRIPMRYTVESGKSLDDIWDVTQDKGNYDLEVYGPNGYFHKFMGNINNSGEPQISLKYDNRRGGIIVNLYNPDNFTILAMITSNAYNYGGPWPFRIAQGKTKKKSWLLKDSGNWYDFSVTTEKGYLHRFAGRVETGLDSVSDPAMATEI